MQNNTTTKPMAKTAMQELIDLLSIDESLFDKTPYLIEIIKDVYIEKERVMIEKVQSDAISNADMTNNRGYFDCDKYYNETYVKSKTPPGAHCEEA